MDGGEILRLVDLIHRDKEIDKEIIFTGIEYALLSAARKKYGNSEKLHVSIDRETGDVEAIFEDEVIETSELGRLAALTAKQVMIQKIREAERDVVYREYIHKVGNMVSGAIRRFEGPNCIVIFEKVEGILPKREQIPGEPHHIGDTVKAVIVDVKKVGQKTRVVLSRTNSALVRRLFALEVPEVADKTVEIKSVARKAGQRTKIAVSSRDLKVDCLGACVGLRGARIKGIVEEINGEKIDIVRWNQSPEVFIMNALKPADISHIEVEEDLKKAYVMVSREQLSLAIGRKGQNVRLVSRLTGWDIDIYSDDEEGEFEQEYDEEKMEIEGAKERLFADETEAPVVTDHEAVEKLKQDFIKPKEEKNPKNSKNSK